MKNMKQDVYVITGSGGGMGRAVARRLSKKGILLLTDINASLMEEGAAELCSLGAKVHTQLSDIADKESMKTLTDKAASLGRLAGLVHTAGISPTMSDWKRIFEVDLIGTAKLLEAFLPLAEEGTAVVCVASMSGSMVTPEPAAMAILSDPLAPDLVDRIEPFLDSNNLTGFSYAFAKRGVMLLCEKMSTSWGERGARIVSISPGVIDTPMGRLELDENPIMKTLLEMSALKRMGKPEDIASAICFLLSEDASYITGIDLRVDGGVVSALMRARER